MARIYHQLGMTAQDRGDLPAAEQWYRRSQEILQALGDRRAMAGGYHQLGLVAQDRGDLAAAERLYCHALEIAEAFDDRPSMAVTCGQLGLLAEAKGDWEAALDWVVRCVVLFPEFPHPATGRAPRHLARLCGILGISALETSWQRCTNAPLPPDIRATVAEMVKDQSEASS
jgi:tetratricopeptide (TPR) repeat protein